MMVRAHLSGVEKERYSPRKIKPSTPSLPKALPVLFRDHCAGVELGVKGRLMLYCLYCEIASLSYKLCAGGLSCHIFHRMCLQPFSLASSATARISALPMPLRRLAGSTHRSRWSQRWLQTIAFQGKGDWWLCLDSDVWGEIRTDHPAEKARQPGVDEESIVDESHDLPVLVSSDESADVAVGILDPRPHGRG